MKYSLYFRNACNEYTLLLRGAEEKKCFEEMFKFLDAHHFHSYYQRVTECKFNDGRNARWIDVGSHCEFFYIVEEKE